MASSKIAKEDSIYLLSFIFLTLPTMINHNEFHAIISQEVFGYGHPKEIS